MVDASSTNIGVHRLATDETCSSLQVDTPRRIRPGVSVPAGGLDHLHPTHTLFIGVPFGAGQGRRARSAARPAFSPRL